MAHTCEQRRGDEAGGIREALGDHQRQGEVKAGEEASFRGRQSLSEKGLFSSMRSLATKMGMESSAAGKQPTLYCCLVTSQAPPDGC